jgi:hypothetical protein
LTGTPNLSSAAPGAAVEAIPIEAVGTTFDYGTLPPDIAEDLQRYVARIRTQVRDLGHSINVIGHFLTRAKQVLAHGLFMRWARAEFGFSVGTAENYMRMYEFTGHDGRFETVRILSPTTLYLISAKNAPPEIVKAVLARAAGGEAVPAAEVRRMIREFKRRNRQGMPGNGRRELSSCEREQAKNEMARANARAIVKRFGRDGAAFILGMRDNILETLSFLEREMDVSDGTHPGGTS